MLLVGKMAEEMLDVVGEMEMEVEAVGGVMMEEIVEVVEV